MILSLFLGKKRKYLSFIKENLTFTGKVSLLDQVLGSKERNYQKKPQKPQSKALKR